MFVRLRIYQEALKFNSNFLDQTRKLDANPKAIQQIEFVGQLKNVDGVNADRTNYVSFNDFRK